MPGTLVGYARTSTTDQKAGLTAQLRDLESAGCTKVFREELSSVAKTRPQLEAALEWVREGDTLVVTKQSEGLSPQQAGTQLASTELILHNPAATITETGTAIAAATVTFLFWGLLFQATQEGAMAFAEDKLKDKTSGRSRLVRLSKRIPGTVALLVVLLLMLVFFTFEAVEGWQLAGWLDALPTVGAAAVVFTALAMGMESLLAVASGAKARIRLLGSGMLALITTSLLVRTAIGYPGYIEELDESGRDDHPPAFVGAVRAVSLYAGIWAIQSLFIIGGLWSFGFLMAGIDMVTATLAGLAFPVRPLPGRDIWDWNKAASIFVLAVNLGFFVLIVGAYLPIAMLFWIGVAGMVLWLAAMMWVRSRMRRFRTQGIGSQEDLERSQARAARGARAAPGRSPQPTGQRRAPGSPIKPGPGSKGRGPGGPAQPGAPGKTTGPARK